MQTLVKRREKDSFNLKISSQGLWRSCSQFMLRGPHASLRSASYFNSRMQQEVKFDKQVKLLNKHFEGVESILKNAANIFSTTVFAVAPY